LRAPKTKQTAGEASSLDEVVRRHIGAVLEEYRGNRSRAAARLGISRRALLRKIEKYGIK
jgi:DNA-binding NtrC family response regulator